ncbi:hypothetical protein [Kutzneria chonburiensis]|uniref:Uncharacterized protein n=1 Tax=Kutzneria chonburiensis TaxID=1483604 RepID=A0ABV6MIR4_9PSEU|nr:hypothetical protein [Kutzneria chonburiensis]
MIDMQVRRELCGEVVARAAAGIAWDTTLGDLDRATFPLVGALIPYGDTVFNHLQAAELLLELDRLPAHHGGAWVDEARALCDLVLRKAHHYLVFVGD